MRVKVAFLETDKNYLQRIVTALSSKYADKLQLYSYTDKEAAIAALRSERIAVLVCTTGFELTADELPANCGLAYLTDSMDVASYQGHPAICKFQKAEQIYKGILSVYAETSASSAAVRYQSGSMAMVILVTSPSGGGGASSVAAGLARRLALRGSRVLYLNYEKLGMSDIYFNGPGQQGMSDVIFAIKSHRGNLRTKVESCARQDESGVYYFAAPAIALDIMELSADEELELMDTVAKSDSYDYVIVDRAFGMGEDDIKVMNKAHRVFWVVEGTAGGVTKASRAYTAFDIMAKRTELPFLRQLVCFYNKYEAGRSAQVEQGPDMSGSIPRFAISDARALTERIAQVEDLDYIL